MEKETKQTKPKIVICLNYPAHYTDKILEELIKDSRIETHVIYYNSTPTDHKEWQRETECKEHIYFCKKNYKIWRDEYYNPDAISFFKKGRYDLAIISGRMPFTSFFLLKLCQKKGIPYIFAADTALLPINREISSEEADVYHRKYNTIINNATGIWTTGSAGKAWWRALYGEAVEDKLIEGRYLLDKEHIVENLSPEEARKQIRSELGFSKNDFVILFVGELLPSRNIKGLMKLHRKLIEDGHACKLLIIGFGEEYRYVKSYVRKYPSDVRYIEGVPYNKLNDFYYASDCYVHPGEEPYSLALVQAVLDGIPVVTTDQVGAAYDYIINGINGFVLPMNDMKAWINACINILKRKKSFYTFDVEKVSELLREKTAMNIANKLIECVLKTI